MRLSANTLQKVWEHKSEHLNPDQPLKKAIDNWLNELVRIEDEDDRVRELEAIEKFERDTDQTHPANQLDDIPF